MDHVLRMLEISLDNGIFLLHSECCTDTAIHFSEVICIGYKSSFDIGMLFENNWFAHCILVHYCVYKILVETFLVLPLTLLYTISSHCIYDNGGEFSGTAFSYLVKIP